MIVSRLGFALMLYDDFSGRPIAAPTARFEGQGGFLVPYRKPEGYYLFPQLGEEPLALGVSVPLYLPEPVEIHRETLEPTAPLVRLRLCRAYSGTYRDCAWVEYEVPPGTQVLAVEEPPGEQLGFRREQGAGEEELLAVTGYTTKRLEGLRYAVESKDGLRDFLLEEKCSPGIYRTSGRGPGTLKAFPLSRAYRSRSDGNGLCRIPVEPGARIQGVYRREGAQWVSLSAAGRS